MADIDIQQPLPVDAKGNISVHGRGGLDLNLPFFDENGDPMDVSALPMSIEVKDCFTKDLMPGEQDHEKRLVITPEEAQLLTKSGKAFAVFDNSDVVNGEVIPDPIWEGLMFVRGFQVAPPVEA